MKTFITFIILFLFLCSPVLPDELQIPFSCWPKEIQKEFALNGLKLDLESSDRTNDSFGYILNKGDSFVIYTYEPLTAEYFELIKKIIFKIELEKRELKDG